MQSRKFSSKISITKNLTNQQVKDICSLKNKHWKFGFKSQIEWFKINSFANDIHYQIYNKKKLIGYLHLGNRSFRKLNIKGDYILFRNLIVDKNFRSSGLSKQIMKFANTYIKSKKKIGFLICKRKLLTYYLKNEWSFKYKKNYTLNDHNHNKMIFMFYNLRYNGRLKFYYKT
tara:strand:- start:309 stop:827 length:519 start_codon:yes stop_codon:yes gene_type:complete